jgi:hypothetical protein
MSNRISTRPLLSRAYLVAIACACTMVAPVHSQAPDPDIAQGTNVLFGRVLDAGTDAPIAGAVVTLTGFFPSATLPRTLETPGSSAPQSVMTNGEGYFFFRELPAGRYAIAAVAFGYMNSTYPLHIVELTNSDRPTTVPVYLWKYAAISGTVFDERGEPMAGVSVSALQRVLVGSSLMLRQTYVEALTDDRGVYRLANLPPGRYIVGVLSNTTTIPESLAREIDVAASDRIAASALRAALTPTMADLASGEGLRVGESVLRRPGPMALPVAEGRMLSYATMFSPGTPVPADATVVALGSGEQRNAIDVPLRLSPTVSVSGVVTGPSGPMKHFAVRLEPPNAADTTSFDPLGVATALSDADGAFTFLSVTPGQYMLTAALVTYERPDSGIPDVSLWAAQPLTVSDSNLTDLAVVLQPGIRVSGRIEFRGSPLSVAPSPQNGMVNLRPIGAQRWRTSSGRLAADGTFRTGGDVPGRYLLRATIQGWTLQTVTRDGDVVADDVIELETTDVSGLVFTFSNKASRVSGSVVDAKGAADAESDVLVFPADTTLWREGVFNDRRVRFMHATSAGGFEFSGLAPGEYYIAAVNNRLTNDWQDPMFLARLIAGATKFTCGEGEERALQLKAFAPRGQ